MDTEFLIELYILLMAANYVALHIEYNFSESHSNFVRVYRTVQDQIYTHFE